MHALAQVQDDKEIYFANFLHKNILDEDDFKIKNVFKIFRNRLYYLGFLLSHQSSL